MNKIRSLRTQLRSARQNNDFTPWHRKSNVPAIAIPVLADHIGDGLAREAAILDGEIVCLDKRGHPRFNDLLFRRGGLCFFGFDLLWNAAEDRVATAVQWTERIMRKIDNVFGKD